MEFKNQLARFGNPQDQLRTILVGGTNGKSSVATLIAITLQAAGYRVGLFTSPHIRHEQERIRVNGTAISIAALATLDTKIKENGLDQISYFERCTLLALLSFLNSRVDFAVMEVGIGGRLDPTNNCDPIASVVTSIGRDHMELLGPTLDDVLREKIAIGRPGKPLVFGPLSKRLKKQAALWCYEQSIPCYFTAVEGKQGFDEQNRYVAELALDRLRTSAPKLDNIDVDRVLQNVQLPARHQRIGNVIVDLAHNEQAFAALNQLLTEPYRLVVAKPKQKEWQRHFEELASGANEVIIANLNDNYFASSSSIYAQLQRIGQHNVHVVDSLDNAFNSSTQLTVVCGSARLAGKVLQCLDVDTTHEWR